VRVRGGDEERRDVDQRDEKREVRRREEKKRVVSCKIDIR
jgi:hypothetical protein